MSQDSGAKPFMQQKISQLILKITMAAWIRLAELGGKTIYPPTPQTAINPAGEKRYNPGLRFRECISIGKMALGVVVVKNIAMLLFNRKVDKQIT